MKIELSPIGFVRTDIEKVPPQHTGHLGVFSFCSPLRPNPRGMSVVEVLGVGGNSVRIKGLDMRDGTPVLDIKPFRERQ